MFSTARVWRSEWKIIVKSVEIYESCVIFSNPEKIDNFAQRFCLWEENVLELVDISHEYCRHWLAAADTTATAKNGRDVSGRSHRSHQITAQSLAKAGSRLSKPNITASPWGISWSARVHQQHKLFPDGRLRHLANFLTIYMLMDSGKWRQWRTVPRRNSIYSPWSNMNTLWLGFLVESPPHSSYTHWTSLKYDSQVSVKFNADMGWIKP